MSANPSDQPRRTFLHAIALGAVGAGVTGTPHVLPGECESSTLGGQSLQATEEHALDTWLAELGGTYRLVVDAVSLRGATEALGYATTYQAVNTRAYRLDAAASRVVAIMRNLAAPFAFANDAWAELKLGSVVGWPEGLSGGGAMANELTEQLRRFTSSGGSVAVCALATQYLASRVARHRGSDVADVRKVLEAALVTGGRIVPSGITTVDRCQRVGFSYAYVG